MLLKELFPHLVEAVYPGNIGIAEVTKFYMAATKEQKDQFKTLVAKKADEAAWELVIKVIGGQRLHKMH